MGEFRANFRGRLSGDIWQYGMVFQSDEDIEGLASRLASQKTSMLTATLRGHMATTTVYDDVYVSELATGTGAVLNTAQAPIGVAGTVASGSLPPQCSIAVGILPVTGTARGRFYLPPFTPATLSPTGRFSSAIQTQWADALQGFFSALGGATSPARLGIWRVGPQSFFAARGIQIGDVFDTQRRRRNKLIETRLDRMVL